jgi:hypothetical protein
MTDTNTRARRRTKIEAMANQTASPEEAKVAQAMLESTSLVEQSQVERALAQAVTLSEMRDVHAMTTAFQAAARARGLGIGHENMAAKYVLRAERMMGEELVRLAEAGELADRATSAAARTTEWGPGRTRVAVEPKAVSKLSLGDLAVSKYEAEKWRALAAIPEDAFNRLLTDLSNRFDGHGNPTRLSRAELGREWFGTPRKDTLVPLYVPPVNAGYSAFRKGVRELLGYGDGEAPTANGLRYLAADELQETRRLIMAMLRAYNEVNGA